MDILFHIIAVLIGLATGAVQFFLLYKFVTTVTGSKVSNKTIIFALTQFLFPFAVLVICAFLLPHSLMWVGIGIGVSLVTCAIIKFLVKPKKKDLTKAEKKKLKKKS